MTDVTATVIRILAAQARLPESAIRLEATPAGLGLDSLGLVETIFAIEEAFDIAVPFNANEGGPREFDLATVGAMVAAVQSLVGAKTGA